MADQAPQTITLDGVSYDIAQFSPAVQQAVGIFNVFQADLQKAQIEVIKMNAAISTVGAQISEAVKGELAAQAEAAAAPVAANDASAPALASV